MAQRSTSRKPKPRSSGASRRSSKKSSGTPVWAWLVAGLLVGLFIAFLIYLNGVDGSGKERPQQQASSEPSKEKATNKESKKAKEKEKAAAKEATPKQRETASAPAKHEPAKQEKPATPPAKEPAKAEPVVTAKATPEKKTAEESKRESSPAKGSDKTLTYDFYKILPKSEVVVPEEELKKPNSPAATTPGTYYLQVGAFRSLGEADTRKAQLALLGIVSAIQTVTIEANSSWHRVRVGPVKDARQLERSKRQLQDNNITFVTIRENN